MTKHTQLTKSEEAEPVEKVKEKAKQNIRTWRRSEGTEPLQQKLQRNMKY